MKINRDRLSARIEALARITDPQRPYTRRSFTDLYLEGRAWVHKEFERVGLDVRLDGAANLIGMRAGSEPDRPPLVVGSHTDTVPDGGRFDGIVGVLAGLEAIQSLTEAGHRTRHPLWVADFLAEEPSAYGVSSIGSRAWAGTLNDTLLAMTGVTGETLADGIVRMGGNRESLPGPLKKPGDIAAFLELHIEQGRVLETESFPIGLVSGIVGIERLHIVVTGRADHAGATPMDLRADALVGSARLIGWIADRAAELARSPEGFVATVGTLDTYPNACNVVPGRVSMMLEFRCLSVERLRDFRAELERRTEQLEEESGLAVVLKPVSHADPARCSSRVMEAIQEACTAAGLPHRTMVSGAGHDAMHMALIAPTGMVFIPCREGRSHCPEEWADPDDSARGAEVLARALLILDQQESDTS